VDQSRRLKLGSRNLHHSFLTLNGTLKFQREDRERGRQIREGYEKMPFSATAGIVFRFTRRRCYRALTVALAGLSCYFGSNNSQFLPNDF